MSPVTEELKVNITLLGGKPLQVSDILADYKLAVVSREASLLGRKEVFMGKAKFGIFGDGKEVAQLAMARAFQNGDFRSGYYRDQTFMFAIGALTVQQYFAQLYAHTSIEADPSSGGRLMNGHFSTRLLDNDGKWLTQTDRKNSSSDISPTGGQMPRLLGLAYASKLYRHLPELAHKTNFSIQGNEVAFGTIGNASTSEGHFWETMNAAGVLQVPMLMSVWDDGYGISVGPEHHTVKQSISEALAGFENTAGQGFAIYKVKGWDYAALISTYQDAAAICREHHIPALVHVVELTQPQGHSTSGSHERYKTSERLAWEKEFDANAQFRQWILKNDLATEDELAEIEKEAKAEVQSARTAAWQAYRAEIEAELDAAEPLIVKIKEAGLLNDTHQRQLDRTNTPGRAELMRVLRRVAYLASGVLREEVIHHIQQSNKKYSHLFNSMLFNGENAITLEEPNQPTDGEKVDGREVLNAFFLDAFARIPELFTLGEDVGKIGDVNQGMAGMQERFGEYRVSDTGIREATILGQGLGASLRGLKPLVEIQYLDYLLYAIQTLSDDVATLAYRTAGGQKAPVIIRTRGHRLEGVWHSGSPMGMIINAVRGMHVIVPRNMAQAAAFYNTCLQLEQPAIVIEPLNGYRLKEVVPTNLATMALPLGVPEVIQEGTDITLVTYGSMCRIALDAANFLIEAGISLEIIDVRTLLPFDTAGVIKESLRKTSRIIFADEDVPGGAAAYMMQQILDVQQGYLLLDSQPRTLSAKAHRPAYGTDGDYFSKPSSEDIIDMCFELMAEAKPARFA